MQVIVPPYVVVGTAQAGTSVCVRTVPTGAGRRFNKVPVAPVVLKTEFAAVPRTVLRLAAATKGQLQTGGVKKIGAVVASHATGEQLEQPAGTAAGAA